MDPTGRSSGGRGMRPGLAWPACLCGSMPARRHLCLLAIATPASAHGSGTQRQHALLPPFALQAGPGVGGQRGAVAGCSVPRSTAGGSGGGEWVDVWGQICGALRQGGGSLEGAAPRLSRGFMHSPLLQTHPPTRPPTHPHPGCSARSMGCRCCACASILQPLNQTTASSSM